MQNADSLHLNLWQGGEPLLFLGKIVHKLLIFNFCLKLEMHTSWEDAPESAFFPSDEQSVGLTGGLFACDVM